MTTLNTFHLFPTLPVEIRLKIWAVNLSIPRTVTILCNKEVIISGAPRSAKSWASVTPTPPLLSVNRESRYEALSIYTPYFTTLSSLRPIYLSFFQDTVKFADGVLPYVPRTPLLEIQKMVLQTKDCAYFGFYNLEILQGMKRLRDLEIYAGVGVVYRYGDGYRYGGDGDRYLDLLMSDFETARVADPGWECPKVKIFDEMGKEMRTVEGGALIPGWEESTTITADQVGEVEGS